MGNSVIIIETVGNHGCQREVKDGGTVYGCGYMGCVDCETRRFIKRLQQNGSIVEAKLIHWPIQGTQGQQLQPSSVVDDLVSGKRTGNF